MSGRVNTVGSKSGVISQNWSGGAYTDPDAVGSSPTAKLYPDGTIVGSTSNGHYTKHPNGDLECRTVDATYTATDSQSNMFGSSAGTIYRLAVTFTFPVAMIDTNYSTTYTTNSIRQESAAPTLSAQLVYIYFYNTDTNAIVFRSMFKGRWKA